MIPTFRLLSAPFFRQRYLRGRYFDASLEGWRWVWRCAWTQRILGINAHIPWPMSAASTIDDPSGVIFDLDDLQNFMHFGLYLSNVGGGKITIGKGTVIAPNVGIITTNHRPDAPDRHEPPAHVVIGGNCWLGMNSVILPGVELGENTVVGAGAVVTKSFPEGWCVLVGSPARVLKRIERPMERIA
jgi:acetyltransferase-like isoleucine patch superfamily enzyme